MHRTRRRRATTAAAAPRRDSLARRDAVDQRELLDRILDTPHLTALIPRMPPELLHRVIQSCGLEDCGELVALATPDQLARVFDLDLWRADRPGRDERLDADRFGVWLEVLVECGAQVAAQKLAEMDVDLVIAALAQHMRVFDRAATVVTIDGEAIDTIGGLDQLLSCDVGGYLVVATRTDSWDAIIAVLTALDARHRTVFQRVMSGCRRLSDSKPEVDGLDDLLTDGEQAAFDLECSRESRRDKQGYVTPAQARAFLRMSRQVHLDDDAAPPGNPVARAYFRAIEPPGAVDAKSGLNRLPAASDTPAPDSGADPIAAVVDVLREAGVLPQQPRALLDGPREEAPRLTRVLRQMQFVCDADPVAYSTRNQELGFLANTLVAGCSIQARPITAQEASDAAVAVCNLGLENWPLRSLPDDFLVGHDLVRVFQVGWKVLHEEVCMHTAAGLISSLADVRCDDRETRRGLVALRTALTKQWRAGTPWRARDALDVIAILDMPAWATLLALIDECPVLHAAMAASRNSRTHAVSSTEFAFISDNSQIAAVHAFVQALPDTLRG